MIRVKNIPFTTTDEEFKELFKDYQINKAEIVRRNGRSKGFGFVEIPKETETQKLLEKINEMELNTRKLFATPVIEVSNTLIYVSNIPWSWKDEDLKNLFKEMQVTKSRVMISRNGRSRGFGYVEFAQPEDKQKAINLDQIKVEERVITIKAYNNKNNNNNRKKTNINNNNNNNNISNKNSPQQQNKEIIVKPNTNYTLYVTNLPFELDENDLKQIFSEFNVKSTKVPLRHNKKSKGYGFAEFNNEKDQNEAMKALDQSEINGRLVSINIAQNPRARNNKNRSNNINNNNNNRRPNNNNNNRRFNNNRNNNTNNNRRFNNNSSINREASSTMLHVSNLAYSVNDVQLASFFKDFRVKSVYIVKNQNGMSAGHGFVDFESNEEQQNALRINNNKEIQGRVFTLQKAWKN